MDTVKTKGKLIYIGDPMCSWCWGIANHLKQLKDHFADQLDFELIVGGLRPGGGDPWNDTMKSFLRNHWNHVHSASGQLFSYDLLEKEHFVYDTEPPCRAVRVVRDLAPEKEFSFFKSIQEKFYMQNEDPNELDFYEGLCEKLDIDFSGFKEKFQADSYRDLTREDFARSRELGINGFPAVLVNIGEKNTPVAMGYSEYDKMRIRIEAVLGNTE